MKKMFIAAISLVSLACQAMEPVQSPLLAIDPETKDAVFHVNRLGQVIVTQYDNIFDFFAHVVNESGKPGPITIEHLTISRQSDYVELSEVVMTDSTMTFYPGHTDFYQIIATPDGETHFIPKKKAQQLTRRVLGLIASKPDTDRFEHGQTCRELVERILPTMNAHEVVRIDLVSGTDQTLPDVVIYPATTGNSGSALKPIPAGLFVLTCMLNGQQLTVRLSNTKTLAYLADQL